MAAETAMQSLTGAATSPYMSEWEVQPHMKTYTLFYITRSLYVSVVESMVS